MVRTHKQSIINASVYIGFFLVQDIVFQLHRFITSMSKYHTDCYDSMKSIMNIFPIEVDLPMSSMSGWSKDEAARTYKGDSDDTVENDDNEDEYDGDEDVGARKNADHLIDISAAN